MFRTSTLPFIFKLLLSMAVLSCSGVAHAGIEVPTRVVFHGTGQDMTLTLRNRGDTPSLVQVWLDEGDPDAPPETIQVPFVLTPSLVRIEPEGSHTLRFVSLPDASLLPQDRETRYFLNLLDIPPKPGQAADDEQAVAGSSLNLAVHYRMPLLYRPAALEPEVATVDLPPQAAAQVRWSLVEREGQWVLEADNPTPFSLSMRKLGIADFSDAASPGQEIAAAEELPVIGGELLPKSKATFSLQSPLTQPPGTRRLFVIFEVANDAGYSVPGLSPIH